MDDFMEQSRSIIPPSINNEETLSTICDEKDKVTIFSVVGIMRNNKRQFLHTFLVMNQNGKKKIFQCFVNSYRIEQWLHGDFIPRYETVIRSLLQSEDKENMRKVLKKYGGSKFVTKKDMTEFIKGLVILCSSSSSPRTINSIGKSIFGGSLFLPGGPSYPLLVLCYHQEDLDIDPDYKPSLSCPVRVLRSIDDTLFPNPQKQQHH
jgi:hypothetical protein